MNRFCVVFLLLLFTQQGWPQEFSIGSEGQRMRFQVLSPQEKTVRIVAQKKEKFTYYRCDIPAVVEYNGISYSVVDIGKEAFRKGKMTMLTIPSTVKSIGDNAFFMCRELTSVSFSEGLDKIGEGAFLGAPVACVIIPSTVTSIGRFAFFSLNSWITEDTKIKTVYIPNTNISIGAHAFNRFRNGYGAWSTSKSEILCLPNSITKEKAKEIGFHEDSYNTYIQQKNSGTLRDVNSVVSTLPVSVNPVASATQQATAPVSANLVSTPKAVAAPVVAAQPTPVNAPKQNNNVTKDISDVDINIPQTSTTNENAFAIIIANEKYDRESEVQFATNDGRTFRQYCISALGIPKENIHYKENATLNNIIAEVDWLKKVCDVFGGEAKVIFYYAGHGIPDEASKDAYLLPVDGIGSNVNTGYKLSKLYETLGKMKTENVSIFLDACFSGMQRDDKFLVSARGVAIKAKPAAPKGAMVVMSAAQGDETAYPYKEKQHGLFTYFLLKKLQESKGECTMEELGNYVKSQVSRRAIIVNGKPQTPSVSYAAEIGGKWKNIKLK